MQIIGVIPARYASTRLKGKPLADIHGKPMIQHTYESALTANLLDRVIVAVDDKRVYQEVKNFGGEVMMTPTEIQTGSDRIAFVVKKIPQAAIIVNIQGDEPFISGKMIDQAIEPMLFDKKVYVSTLAKKINSITELKNPSVVKVVFDYQNYALYFSRAPIPFSRDAINSSDKLWVTEAYKHVGLYVYRRDFLLKYSQMEVTDLEQIEKLEQLRILENGFRIKVVETEYESLAVDTKEDLEKARIYFKKNQRLKAK
ncbi:MAG: 3-deoxy-manno-octulosonate cytidylyltransferase [Chlorobiaceae bacterium]|nr:3-deoxy-manno-octulosonate cytidylyltransferase [Chlorobiaceae bacterium]MBA4309978.1 3-deoxy-manno-octulosonate cytidylyltransferase [Chlorobiaceae bacterium]